MVDDLNAGGHAESAGVRPGDRLLASSARAAGGAGPRGAYVLFPTAGERFKTVRGWVKGGRGVPCQPGALPAADADRSRMMPWSAPSGPSSPPRRAGGCSDQ